MSRSSIVRLINLARSLFRGIEEIFDRYRISSPSNVKWISQKYLFSLDDAGHELLLVQQQLLLLPGHRRLGPGHEPRDHDEDERDERQGQEGVDLVVGWNPFPNSTNRSLENRGR